MGDSSTDLKRQLDALERLHLFATLDKIDQEPKVWDRVCLVRGEYETALIVERAAVGGWS